MPSRSWLCKKCETWNGPSHTVCAECSAPAPSEAELVERRNAAIEEATAEFEEDTGETPGRWENDTYIPNTFRADVRIKNVFFSIALVAWGTFGVYIDDLILPTKRGNALHLHGIEAWFMYAAFLAAAAGMISVVIDHFDVRPNEATYDKILKYSNWAMYSFGALSIAMLFYHLFNK